MSSRDDKNALFDAFADIAKAMGNGRRAELIDVLAQGERTVDELAAEIDQSIANTSFHLRNLATAGLVQTRRNGTHIYYRLASSRVGELWEALRDVAAEHHSQLAALAEAYLGDRAGLDTIGRGELSELVEGGDVIVIDVRNETEFGAGHIEGARSIPIDELADRVDEIPDGVEIVAYCRGPYCVYADDAVRLLNDRDRRARRMDGGFPEWAADSLPTTASSE